MPDRVRLFMYAVKIMKLNELNGRERLITLLVLIIMINEVVKLHQLIHEMTGSNDLNGNHEKKDPFHLLKIGFSWGNKTMVATLIFKKIVFSVTDKNH